ncbi:MAG: EAL domain-containing protein [Rudaea sp.]
MTTSAYRLKLAAGDTLFRAGDPPTTAFLIEQGTLRVTARHDGGDVVLGDLGPGALLGEMAVLDDAPRTATAVALTDCVLTPVDSKQFAERLEVADPIVRALLFSQLARYRAALATLSGGAVPASIEDTTPSRGSAHAHDKIRLESQLREALELKTLDVLLQPIWNIESQRVAGYEALTRWRHPERGAVSPAEFIALAEETSLIVPVGEYVLDAVCAALRRFPDAPAPFIALNVSGRQLRDAGFVDLVLACARKHAVSASLIKLEITESLVLDYEQVNTLIARCHDAGIRVALDDFGTGYSNLGHLHRLAFDTLKLDQGFVRRLDEPRCLAVVRAIFGMARALGCDIVAEGVETQSELDKLTALDCDNAQGYLIGRPQSVDDALQAFAAQRPTGS